MVLYGEYGVGKTWLAATAEDVPSMRDVLYIDAESGDLTLQDRSGIDVVRIGNFSTMARVFEFLQKHCDARDRHDTDKLLELDELLREGEPRVRRYKTVIVDSLTEVFKYCMYQLTGTVIGKGSLDMEPDQPGFSEWGKSTEMIRLLVRNFRDLPMHVIFVCSEKPWEDKNKRATIGLNLSKSLAAEVPGFVDVVGYLAANASGGDRNNQVLERRLYLQAGQGFLAKNRFGGGGAYIEDPHMSKLVALVRNENREKA